MNNSWDNLIAEFRSHGGIADNIYQKKGSYGMGIFPINPKLKSRIFIPKKLLIKKEDIYLENNKLRIKRDKSYEDGVKNFFYLYQDNLAWGGEARETTELFEKGLLEFPPSLKNVLKKYTLFDIEKRHKGAWSEIIKREFLNSRSLDFYNSSVIAPIFELVNHEVNSYPFYRKFDGFVTPNYLPRDKELTFSYGCQSSFSRVFKYGFFSKESLIFSFPFNIKLNNKNINVICKGLDLNRDKTNVQFDDSNIIIEGLPIASKNKSSFVKNFFEYLAAKVNKDIFSKELLKLILNINIDYRKEIQKELGSIDNFSSRIINKSINYELDSISLD
mgnify:CR=1 FL=1